MATGEGEGSGTPAGGAGLQFDKVELPAPEAGRACGRCRRLIDHDGEYFEISGSVVCRACADELAGARAGNAAFLRALVYGAGAALLGTIVWFAIIKIANWELGIIAVAVGLFVGYAVRRGSGGRGGWKYQALAIALTYVSVTTSKVPFVLQAAGEQADKLAVFAIALASPFLMGKDNIMGILILGIALYEAWKINKRLPISGPFRMGRAVPPAPVLPPAATT